MKKISIVLALVILVSAFAYDVSDAFASETDRTDWAYEKAYTVLRGLGIIDGDDWAETGPDDNISCAEFSRLVINAAGGIDEHGIGTQLTAPVTYDNAVRMIMTALGYGYAAQNQGGFPVGYNLLAAGAGIFKNISVKGSDTATVRNLAIMLHNALTVDMMKNSDISGGAGGYQVNKGETFLRNFEERQSIKIISGQVMATPVSSLVGGANVVSGRINIDGVVYFLKEGVSCSGLLGKIVMAFVNTDKDSDMKTVYSIAPYAGKNRELKLKASDIISYSNYRYAYESESKSNAIEYIDIPRDISVIYNGVGLGSVNSEDLNVLSGTLTFIDTQSSGIYDLLYIEEYRNYLVSDVDSENEIITFRNNPYEEKWSLSIKSDDRQYKYFILNDKNSYLKEYQKGDLDQFDINDVVSIFESKDEKVITLAISDESVEGKIDELAYDDGIVIIDGEKYNLFKHSNEEYLVLASDLQVGETAVFYLDVNKEIVCVDTTGGKIENKELKALSAGYAYVIEAKAGTGLSGSMQLRLLRGSVLREPEVDKISENDLSKQDEEKSVKLSEKQIYGQRVEVGACAANVILEEGEQRARVKSNTLADLEGKVIEFAIDSEGLITKITVYSGEERSRRYNDEFKTFTDATPDGAFMVDENTVFFVVPSTATTDSDYEVRYSIVDTGYYNIAPYNRQRTFNSDFEIARMCVIRSSVSGHRLGIITDNTPISIITKVVAAVNEKDEITTKVYAYTSGIHTGYLMRTPYKGEFVPEPPKVGDVVKLSIDGDGNIDNYMKLISLSDKSLPLFRAGARTSNERLYGVVYDKRQDMLQGLTGKVVKQIKVSYLEDFSDMFTFGISAALEKQMYLYDRRSNETKLAGYNDIMTYMTNGDEASKVFLHITLGEIRGLVIIKE